MLLLFDFIKDVLIAAEEELPLRVQGSQLVDDLENVPLDRHLIVPVGDDDVIVVARRSSSAKYASIRFFTPSPRWADTCRWRSRGAATDQHLRAVIAHPVKFGLVRAVPFRKAPPEHRPPDAEAV